MKQAYHGLYLELHLTNYLCVMAVLDKSVLVTVVFLRGYRCVWIKTCSHELVV